MRRVTFSLLTLLLASPVLAAGGVTRLLPESGQKNSTEITERKTPTVSSETKDNTTPRVVPSRMTTERDVNEKSVERTVSTRAVVRNSGTTTKKSENSTATRSVNRAKAVTRSLQSDNDTRSEVKAAARNVGRNQRTEAASINNNPAVRRMGVTLRPSTAEVGGRATIGDTGVQTGSNMASEIRNVQTRALTSKKTEKKLDAAAISAAKDQMEKEAELNMSCQEMYNNCMDQFCAVVDSNQKRCSCSANLSKYNKVEKAVKEANVKLNEVAQNIRYVGLSADEISAILSATEAEEALSKKTDKTESRSMLTEIEKMIKDPTVSASSSYDSDSYGMLDIDLDFSSDDVSDMFNLDFLNGGSAKSFSNLRGSDLYNAAKKRCDSVLNQCKTAGATADQITGNYDLAIDKDCLAYENGLNKMNETLISNVRSANRMLQKARLAVLQNQNTYDARECVGALETCMTDEMVCGENYLKCLDPTKKYVDENGNVVLGQDVNNIQKFMENYNNANISFTNAANTSITDDVCSTSAGNDGRCIVKYLLEKIGTGQKLADGGLCRPVLDKCRMYTYDDKDVYKPYNEIVQNFVQRAMVNIKAGQYKIVSDYASTCLNDLADCYNQQITQLNSWSSSANQTDVYNVVRGACRNIGLTCAYAVFANDTTSCPRTGNDAEQKCLKSISIMFDPTVACPENSTYVGNGAGEINNGQCMCNENFVAVGGSCVTCGSWVSYTDYTGFNCQSVALLEEDYNRTRAALPAWSISRMDSYECYSIYESMNSDDEDNPDHFSGQCTCPNGMTWSRSSNKCVSSGS
ncbi:MAG: hypothetical protein K6B71_01335 [Alphaproteobacteria bacterium]|nr:hypothetical protein [Alphaproteobacteria bacterium]